MVSWQRVLRQRCDRVMSLNRRSGRPVIRDETKLFSYSSDAGHAARGRGNHRFRRDPRENP